MTGTGDFLTTQPKAALVAFCLAASEPLEEDAVAYPVCRWGTWQFVRFRSLLMYITNKCWSWDSNSSLSKLRVCVLGHDSPWRSAWQSVSAQKAEAVIKMLAVVMVYHAWYLWSIHSGCSKHLIELGTLSVWERRVAHANSLSIGERKPGKDEQFAFRYRVLAWIPQVPFAFLVSTNSQCQPLCSLSLTFAYVNENKRGVLK